MRHPKHIKVITSQVENLEDLKCHLESLVDSIRNLIKQGTSWMNETDSNISFVQINQLLASKTASCIQKCLNITDGNQDMSCTSSMNESLNSTVSDISYQDDKEDTDLKEKLSKQSDHLQQLKQKITDHKRRLKTLARKNIAIDGKVDSVYKEFMTELHSANEFMSSLQSQIEILTGEFKERDIIMNDIKMKIEMHERDMKEEISKIRLKQDIQENGLKQEISDIKQNQQMQENTRTAGYNLTKLQDERINKLETVMKSQEEKFQNLSANQKIFEESNKEQWSKLNENFQELHKLFCSSSKSTNRLVKEQSSYKDDIKQKVIALENQIVDVSKKIEVLRKDNLNTIDAPAGFVANCKSEISTDFYTDKIVTSFCDVSTDILNNFNPKLGIFKAPCNGLYLCFIMIDCNSTLQNFLGFSLFHKQIVNDKETQICGTYVSKKDTTASSVGFVQMSTNDEFYVRPWESYTNIMLSHCSEIMCVLIKKY